MLAGFAWWGFTAFDGPMRWLIGLGVPLVAAIVWGWFFAPKARVTFPHALTLTGRTALLLLGAAALWGIGNNGLAIAQTALVALGTALTWGWVAGVAAPQTPDVGAGF